MLLYSISLIGLLLLSCIVQQFLPSVSSWYDARFLILPLIVLCGSVTVSTGIMLILAYLGGFLWDAQQILSVTQGDPFVYLESMGETLHLWVSHGREMTECIGIG